MIGLDIIPGLVDMPSEKYHDLPAFSAGGAWTLLQKSPLHFWTASPLNPDYAADHKREFDIGTAAHLSILEPARFLQGIRIVEVKKKDGTLADDYRTDAAKLIRDEAYAEGRVPLFEHQLQQVKTIREAIFAHPVAGGIFADGAGEQSFLWRDPETTIPCKARADWIAGNDGYIADLKVHTSASPRDFPRQAMSLGYVLRAAWYLDGYQHATGRTIPDYRFVVVERDPPHCIAVYRCPERVIDWGRQFCTTALAILAQCLVKDECWGYRKAPFDADAEFDLELPSWAEYQLQDRHEEGEFSIERPSPEALKRAMQFYAPLERTD